jgi:hypothetical protein
MDVPIPETRKPRVFALGSDSVVGAAGFEPVADPIGDLIRAENKAFRETDETPNPGFENRNYADRGGACGSLCDSTDPIERALAHALEGATAAGEWSTVAQLGRELEARRTARLGVVDLATVRARRNGGDL